MRIQSTAFANEAEIPVKHTCEGDDASPALAWSGVGLIAFVPLVGLAVFPLQIAALLLRGLAFEYLGITALGAYLTLYLGYASRRAEAVGRSPLTSRLGASARA